jgi:hypothetical protein
MRNATGALSDAASQTASQGMQMAKSAYDVECTLWGGQVEDLRIG